MTTALTINAKGTHSVKVAYPNKVDLMEVETMESHNGQLQEHDTGKHQNRS